MSYFKNKTILITGGTGSWGRELTKRLLPENPKQIRIYSRGEHAQVEMMRSFNDPRLDFYVGDVRDQERLVETTRGVDIIFHLAALKHVPVCERHIWEAIQTNIVGTKAVVEAALLNNVDKAIYVSSDKAVEPINLYGQTKAISEKIFVAANSLPGKTRFACLRAGNVIGTRGSVIPLFVKQIQESDRITVTDKNMTRFFQLVQPVIGLLVETAAKAEGGEIFVPKMPAAKIETLVRVMISKLKNKKIKIEYPGIRPGEKIDEVLVSRTELSRTAELPDYFVILPYDFLTKKYNFSRHRKHMTKRTQEYGSGNITHLGTEEIENLLNKAGYLSYSS